DLEGDIRFLEALLIDDSIPFLVNESSESDFDNPSFPRPPLEPPDAEFDFKPDSAGDEISVVMNDNDKLEYLYPKDEFDASNNENDDYSSFMFVIYSKMFLSFLSVEKLNAEIAKTIIKSLPSLPIPVQDGDSQKEEIDILTETDDVLPPDEFDASNNENDDYSSFMFVIYSKMFLSFLSVESEDTIFDPGISV
nr:hypothetical protein [Tanacetum cinerariifolium]